MKKTRLSGGKKIILATLIFAVVALSPAVVFSQIFGFGGKILFVVPCAIPPGLILVVGPPSPGAYMHLPPPASFPHILFQFFRPGPHIKGIFTPFGGCAFPPTPLTGTIIREGTSNPPSL